MDGTSPDQRYCPISVRERALAANIYDTALKAKVGHGIQTLNSEFPQSTMQRWTVHRGLHLQSRCALLTMQTAMYQENHQIHHGEIMQGLTEVGESAATAQGEFGPVGDSRPPWITDLPTGQTCGQPAVRPVHSYLPLPSISRLRPDALRLPGAASCPAPTGFAQGHHPQTF